MRFPREIAIGGIMAASCLAALTLGGCVAATVAGTAVSATGTAVKTTATVAQTTGRVAGATVGAAASGVRAVAGARRNADFDEGPHRAD